ncbi:Ig-like domain-containing protein [Lewinella sp. 4G2]|uniref:Ig-like domain-containing protein n=1 Tax=Lewinella sp. 4G2 TaxID=1803372 RepID=UPI0007E09460|nr:Ig-like domain-containing protein [Lewinella sp. 4G2]OAV42634.1 hypothetical protein A3850_015420 [Lewinella sp. 4G2]
MFLRRFLVLFTLLVGGVFATLNAQSEVLVTVTNEPVSINFLSQYAPSLGQSPQHGEVTMVEDPIFNYTLTYTPDEDYVGLDQFLLISQPFGFNVQFTNYRVEVRKADIRALHDQAVTTAGQPVMIPVLDNDFSNVGGIELTAVPVANAGTAEIVGDQVRFTPEPDFTGLADINYVICTNGETCDLGTITVSVAGAAAGAGQRDTVRVFTKKNEPQLIFADPAATPLTGPSHGAMIDSAGLMAYAPNEDFTGDETLVYQDAAGNTTVFEVTVLDLVDDQFTAEDRAYTPVDAPITFNVLHNDVYTVFADCVVYGAPRYGTITETNLRGEVIYTPPTGWSGVDRFTYSSKAPGCNGEPELQTAYVFVSDYAPEDGLQVLTLPAGSSLPITYDVPNGAASWSINSSPSYGSLIVDAQNGGLIYTARATAAGQTDNFNVTYCLNADAGGNCAVSKVIPVAVQITAGTAQNCNTAECIWPGDVNNDGVVNVGDLLPIGRAMGKSGTPRLSGDATAWGGQTSEDWGQTLEGLDLKYADANGDQIISALDTQVVIANLGKAHRLTAKAQTFTTFELSIIGPAEAEPGDLILLDIVAGTENVVVEDIYGFIFPFVYDPAALEPNSITLDFDESSWAGYGSPVISLSTNDEVAGILNMGMSRTNGRATSGWGPLGQFSSVVVEDIYGFYGSDDTDGGAGATGNDIELSFGGGTGMVTNQAGLEAAVRVNPTTVRIVNNSEDLGERDASDANAYLDGKLLTFPNPTSDRITVHLNGQQRFTALRLTDLTGRTVTNLKGLDTNHQILDLHQLSRGVYTLTVTTKDGVVNRLIQVQ